MDRRRKVIVAGLGVFAAELIIGVWYPVPIYIACLASMAILLGVAVVVAVRHNRRPWATLLVDERDRSFRTPLYASNLLLGLLILQLAGLCLVGVHETWAGLVAGLFFGGVLAAMWRAMWRGVDLTLRPSGIEAGKMAGALTIPWEALAPEPPVRHENWWQIKLPYARPELVTMTGWTPTRDEVAFEDGDPDLVARAIATYAAEPDRRHAIGTLAELERLTAGIPAQRRGRIREVVEPAPTRTTTVRRVIVGLVLLVLSMVAAGVADWQGWPLWVASPFGWFGGRQLYVAVVGWRAARRARRGAAESPEGEQPDLPRAPSAPERENHA